MEIDPNWQLSQNDVLWVLKASSIGGFAVAVVLAVSGEWGSSAVAALIGVLYVLSYAFMRSFTD